MEQIKVLLPAMGEGIFEATITRWLVNEGDFIEEDDSLVEIATDKVDSEVPAPKSGKILKVLVPEGNIAKVGEIIVIIEADGEAGNQVVPTEPKAENKSNEDKTDTPVQIDEIKTPSDYPGIPHRLKSGKFLSPLVRSIANQEQISVQELESIEATGIENRMTKHDILNYIQSKPTLDQNTVKTEAPSTEPVKIVKMDRMRKLIADHMVKSKQISPHVTSFHEVDVTSIVNWRTKNKEKFINTHGEKLTYTPIFIEAVIDAIKEFPLINVSVEDDNILLKKNINIGMATALTDGNLIVPVIKNADRLNLAGLAHKVNDFAHRARTKALQPNEIAGGTFTITNVGSFGNLTGTPIINQPQVAILAIGTITKRPAVIETSQGDMIGIRQMMILSLSYDHRVVDGSLGGMFLKKIADNLEAFDESKSI